jgi:hypothetical protein
MAEKLTAFVRSFKMANVHQIFCSTGVDSKVDVGIYVHGLLMSLAR